MSENRTAVGLSGLEGSLGFGITVGLVLGVVERFFVHVELTTLAVALVVFGVSRFGDRSSVHVGRALAAVGATSFLALRALLLLFG